MSASEENASSSKMRENEVFEWTVKNEVEFLLALLGHKPVGITKYFHMACILDKFSMAVNREDISSKVIWDRLNTMYDLQALEETEGIPFPNETEEFSLPLAQYGSLVEQKKNGKMPPPPAPSPPPDTRKDDGKEAKKDISASVKKDSKDVVKKIDDKKNNKEVKKEVKEENKKDKRSSKDPYEDKKKEASKAKETKDSRVGTKRGSFTKDDDDTLSNSSNVSKRSRDYDDDLPASSKRSSNAQASSNKGKRQTRLSHGRVSDDSGSNKSVSPLTVPSTKRRR